MSSSLAFAVVTECLKGVLTEALNDISSAIGDYRVSSVAPDLVVPANLAMNQVNVFLYRVSSNHGFSNADLPTRSQLGELTGRPVLAVDLHYLITAYSKNESQAEILLGRVAQFFHERPFLTKQDVRKNEEKWVVDPNPFLKSIADSGLSSQMEPVKFTPHPLSSEELSKLWSAFQASYRPTVSYQASVLLLKKKDPRRNPLPVLTIGRNDSGVTAQPNLIPPVPMLTEAVFPDKELVAILDDVVLLQGNHLEGGEPLVRFTNLGTKKVLETDTLQEQASTGIRVKLSDAGDPKIPADPPERAWSVGHYSAVFRLTRPGEIEERFTNSLVMTLAPNVDAIQLTRAGDVLKAKVTCTPEVLPTQSASLILAGFEMAAKPHANPTDTLNFEMKLPAGLEPGEKYVCRLQVDGVTSRFIDRTKTPPEFLAGTMKILP